MKKIILVITIVLLLVSCTSPSNNSSIVAQLPNVTIGTQIWTSSNLDITTYRDGTPIPQVTDPTAWVNLTTGAWCYYNNDSSNGTTYGKLYNWYAVAGIYNAASLDKPSLRKQFAPSGWHVPSNDEWTTLMTFLGGEVVSGGKMKETGTIHWMASNISYDNSSGFTGLPAGFRESNNGGFFLISNFGYWWSSSATSTTFAISRNLYFNTNQIYTDYVNNSSGLSVRCIRD